MPTVNSNICFDTQLYDLKGSVILLLPKAASDKLLTRGQTMVQGILNEVEFRTPLEPDGKGSHYFVVDPTLLGKAKLAAGQAAKLQLTPINDWDEPKVPIDLQKALTANKAAHELWENITPLARWEWIRQIRGTNNPATRQRRIEAACSKLAQGKRRPCCWNRNACSDPLLSKNGVLLAENL